MFPPKHSFSRVGGRDPPIFGWEISSFPPWILQFFPHPTKFSNIRSLQKGHTLRPWNAEGAEQIPDWKKSASPWVPFSCCCPCDVSDSHTHTLFDVRFFYKNNSDDVQILCLWFLEKICAFVECRIKQSSWSNDQHALWRECRREWCRVR